MKKILGLDLGTNTIGWGVIKRDVELKNKENHFGFIGIEAANTRNIPMNGDIINKFNKGESISKTSERTKCRGNRRLNERHKLRRERLYRVLNIMGFLPKHFSDKLTRYGKFADESEPKLPWHKDDCGVNTFLFQESYSASIRFFSLRSTLFTSTFTCFFR